MDSAGIIFKPQITALTVTLSAGIRELVQLFLYYCSEVIRFEASGNWKVLKNMKSVLHLSHLVLITSGIIESSQSTPLRHKSCRIHFPSNSTGAIKPSGSKMELTVERIPLLVQGRSFNAIRNWNVSDWIHHWSLSAHSMVNLSRSMFMLLRSSVLSIIGMFFMTSFLLETTWSNGLPPQSWYRS